MFIFILQGVWLYISELAGKDLDPIVVLKFLWLYSPKVIQLVLPLSILVASLMVFGGFAERYEFAAMKSTGISLQRAMASLMVFITLLGITAFFFANNVIPSAEYKWINLRRNISQFKPSMIIAEGQFSQIGDDFNIKVASKSGERGQYLKDVIIHKKNKRKPNANYTVMIAEDGELTSEEGSNTLSLILKKGNYYEDMQVKKFDRKQRKPFLKTYFDEYTINIDLTELNNQSLDKDNNLTNHNMYNVSELVTEIDSLSKAFNKDIIKFGDQMYYRTGSAKYKDKRVKNTPVPDSVKTVTDLFTIQQRAEVFKTALNNTSSALQSIGTRKKELLRKTRTLNKHEMAFHDKFALGIACIILFFIGAPLGAIIRKGGMGLPMVLAIVLFLAYHFIGIFAKNSAEDGSLHPMLASWTSTIIMFPLSIWLTMRATTDRGVMDMDAFLQRIKNLFSKNKGNTNAELSAPLLLTQQEKAFILSKDEDELINIIKTADSNNYTEDIIKAAKQRLSEIKNKK